MKLWHPRETIIKRRRELGLSPAMLAQKLGVSQTCVWNWEQGNTWPRPKNIVALAGVLDVDPSDLMLKEDQPQMDPTEQVGVDSILDDAKGRLAAALGLPKERVQVTFSVATQL